MTNNQIHTVRSLGHEQPFTAAAAMLHGASAKIELTELERYGNFGIVLVQTSRISSSTRPLHPRRAMCL